MEIKNLFAEEPKSISPKLHKKIGEIEIYEITELNAPLLKPLMEETRNLKLDDKKGWLGVSIKAMRVLTNIPFDLMEPEQLEDLMIKPSDMFKEAVHEVTNIINDFLANLKEEAEEVKQIVKKVEPKKEINIADKLKSVDKEFGDIKVYKLNPLIGKKVVEFIKICTQTKDEIMLNEKGMQFDTLDQIKLLTFFTDLTDEEAATKLVIRDKNAEDAITYIVTEVVQNIIDLGMDAFEKIDPKDMKKEIDSILKNKSYSVEQKLAVKKYYDAYLRNQKEDDVNG